MSQLLSVVSFVTVTVTGHFRNVNECWIMFEHIILTKEKTLLEKFSKSYKVV